MKTMKVRQVKSLKQPHQKAFQTYRLSSLFLTMCIVYMANAQFYGWPASTGPLGPEEDGLSMTVDGTTLSGIDYADNDRLRVTNATLMGGSDYELDVTSPSGININALSFPVDKWCFMIQMEDYTGSPTSVGFNTRLEVINFTPMTTTTGTLQVRVPSGISNLPTQFDFHSSSRVQIIRVPIYRELYLEPKGQLSCHPYSHDDGTGGVLPFVASKQLYLNGGIVNVSGKGYHVGGSYVPGAGTSGASASASYTPSTSGMWPGGPFPYASIVSQPSFGTNPPVTLDPNDNGYLCSVIPGSINDFDITTHSPLAEQGGEPNNTAGAANTTSGVVDRYYPSNPSHSTSWDTIRMGNSGDPGTYGATGGGGGGFGGKGGDHIYGSGLPGTAGFAGVAGGDAGEAARGGGIIIFKLRTFSIAASLSTSQDFFFANGEHGKRGGSGGRGGNGGYGGLGADGDCDGGKIIPPGGVGGYGESGIGGDGGDGGDAGASGSIWLMKKTSTPLGSRVSLRGGYGGPGGRGGYSLKYYTLPLANNWVSPGLAGLSCNVGKEYSFCAPAPPCPPIETCDCEKVFEQLEKIKTPTTFQTALIPYSLTSGSNYPVYYDNNYYNSGIHALYYTDYSATPCPTTYKCIMYRQALYEKMILKLYKKADLETYAGATANVGFNNIYYPVLGGAVVNLDYIGGSNWSGLKFTGGSSFDQLEDLDDPSLPIVYGTQCNYSYSGSGNTVSPRSGGSVENPPVTEAYAYDEKTGGDGGNGTDAADNSGSSDWFDEDDDAPRIERDNGEQKFLETTDLIIIQTANDNTKSIKLNDIDLPARFVLIDMHGKTVAEGEIDGAARLPQVATGTYLLKVSQGAALDIRKIVF